MRRGKCGLKDRLTGPTFGEEKFLTFILSLLERERKGEPPQRACRMRARELPISQGQKSFVRDLVVFDGVDAYL